MFRLSAAAAVILAVHLSTAPIVHAGIADTPLPVLVTGKTTLLLYSVPGVIRGASDLVTVFICTSTDTASQQVGVEIFPRGGGGPCNDAAATSLSIAPGGTAVFSTGSISNELLGNQGPDSVVLGCLGSGRILSTSKKLECTAFVGDGVNNPPSTSWQLTVIAKLKQKAAN